MKTSATMGAWWRQQRAWLLGALLLGAIVLAWPTWDAWRVYRSQHAIAPIEVAADTSVDFGGARWRLGAVEILSAKDQHLAQPLPPYAAILIAHISMTPLAPLADADRHGLGACDGRLADAAGREWSPDPPELAQLRLDEPRSCVAGFVDDVKPQSAAAGTTWHFVNVYLIPEDVAVTATPEIILPLRRPAFLRFERR